MVGAFGLSTSSKCNPQSKATCGSQSDTFSLGSNGELLAFIWQPAIHHHLIIDKEDECHSLSKYFICFSLTWWTHNITVILSHSLFCLILLSFLSSLLLPVLLLVSFSSFLCKTLSSFLTPPRCCVWRLCAFPRGYQGQHGWRGTSGFVKN